MNPRAACGALWVFEDFVGASARIFIGATLLGMT
jgi:predicted anti-sigma-YlaC factor YlaD